MSLRPPPLWLITLLYYVVWIGTIQCAARGAPASGALLHLAFGSSLISLSPRARRPRLWLRGALGALVGYSFDSALVYLGLISFPAEATLGGPSPLWMVSLWFTFSVLLNRELSWLLKRPSLAVCLGLFGGPISYLGGAQSGAMHTHGSVSSAALTIGLAWGSLMWLAALIWSPEEGATPPEPDHQERAPEGGKPEREPHEP